MTVLKIIWHGISMRLEELIECDSSVPASAGMSEEMFTFTWKSFKLRKGMV